MSALDALLWTVTILLWLVLIIPVAGVSGVAAYIVVRDLVEHGGLPKPTKPPEPHTAKVYLLHPKEPA